VQRPDGPMRKWIDSSKLQRFGWRPKQSLQAGLAKTYQSFITETHE
jgi:GDP-L-fucose synthase